MITRPECGRTSRIDNEVLTADIVRFVVATTSVAGALLIIIQPVEPSVGREYIGRVFAICVLGGLGSLPGTVIGAMLLGILESFTATFYVPQRTSIDTRIIAFDLMRVSCR